MRRKTDALSLEPFTLRGSWWFRVVDGFVVLILTTVGLALLPGVSESEPGLVIFFYTFLGVMLAIPIRAIYRSFTRVMVYDLGLVIIRPFRPSQFLSWWKIKRIRSSAWGESLELADASGRIKADVYAYLSNSHYILGWLVLVRPDLWKPEEGLAFSKSAVTSLFFLVGAVLSFAFAAVGWSIGLAGAWFFAVMGALCMALMLTQPYRLTLDGDALALRYPFRTRTVGAYEIQSLELVHGLLGHVELKLKSGKTIVLQLFSLGAGMLHGFLSLWHWSKTRRELVPTGWATTYGGVPPQLLELPRLNPPANDAGRLRGEE